MRPIVRIFFTALIALCWSGLATADTTEPTAQIEPSAIRALLNIDLDHDFESIVLPDSQQRLPGLAGPSSMDCSGAESNGGIETCLVTTTTMASTVPAALTQH